MLLKMFAVYDHKASIFGQPFFSPQTGSAKRAFSSACNDPQNDFSKYPDDFELFELGTWDDNTAEVVMNARPETLGRASTFIVSK